MNKKLTKTIGLNDIVRVLRGSKEGRHWQLIVVNRNLKNDPELIEQLIKGGAEVINCVER